MKLFGSLWVSAVSAHLPIVAELITILFALMGANNELQVVSVQEVLCDIGTPVAAPTSHLIGYAAVLAHGVTPQQVQDLEVDRNDQRERFNFEELS